MVNRKSIAEKFAKEISSDKIDRIILFGSVARGEDNDDSDIDLLIVSDNYHEIEPVISEGIFNMISEYGELVSAHVMTNETFNRTKNYSFLTRVLNEGINLVWTDDYSAVVDIDERTARLKIAHAEEFIKKAEELLSQDD